MIESGFAANTADLLNKLRIFVTSTLPISERWTQLRYNSSSGVEELIIQGNGTGVDTIICGLKHYYNVGTTNSELILQHFSSYNNSATFEDQPNGIPQLQNYIALPLITPAIFLPNTISYWFIANSRCIKIIAKVTVNYMHAYLGFIYPYANPLDWPNPVCIGGNSIADFDGMPLRYFDTSNDGLTAYWNPTDGYELGKYQHLSTLCIKNTNGSQRRLYNQSDNAYDGLSQGTWPYLEIARSLYGQYNTVIRNSNNNYHTIPIMIVDNEGSGIYGEFEGVRYVTGNGLNAEDTLTINGETWLCVPNTNLLSANQFAAYRMV